MPELQTIATAPAATPREIGTWSTADRSTPARPREQRRAATAVPSTNPGVIGLAAEDPAELAAGRFDVAIAELPSPRSWPSLPGAANPSFPGLLIGVLLGFVALACRGDRRDPKLIAAAIDDQGTRTSFE